jgi:hypothetical protein
MVIYYASALDWHNLDALFLINVYNSFEFCSFLVETVGIRVPTINFRDFPLFTVGSSLKSCSSARCASAVNAVWFH